MGEDALDNIVEVVGESLPPDIVIIEEASGDKGNVPAYYGGIWEGAIRMTYIILIDNGRLQFHPQAPRERSGYIPLAGKITKKTHARDAVAHVLAYLKKHKPEIFEKVRAKYA